MSTPKPPTWAPITSAAQVSVGAVQPVLARRIEYIDIQRILERQRTMLEVGWDDEHLAGAHGHFTIALRSEPELQRALQNVGYLLIHMRVLRYIVALLQIHMGNHHAFS